MNKRQARTALKQARRDLKKANATGARAKTARLDKIADKREEVALAAIDLYENIITGQFSQEELNYQKNELALLEMELAEMDMESKSRPKVLEAKIRYMNALKVKIDARIERYKIELKKHEDASLKKKETFVDKVNQLFNLNNGVLTWNDTGEEAGFIAGSGYRMVKYKGRTYQAHRIVWLITHGAWPTRKLMHINDNKSDNRIENLQRVGDKLIVKSLVKSKKRFVQYYHHAKNTTYVECSFQDCHQFKHTNCTFIDCTTDGSVKF